MVRKTDALNEMKVRNAKPANKPYKLFDGRGLFLLVNPNGSKWWRFKYRYGGKDKLLSLGVYPDVGLKQARERRDDARRLVADGKNPSAERKAGRPALRGFKGLPLAGPTFEEVAREWFKTFSPSWAGTHSHTIIQRLQDNVFRWIGAKPIGEISAAEVLEVLRRIEERGAFSVAHRTNQIIGQVFRYAIADGGKASRDPTADLKGALVPEDKGHFGALTEPAEVAGLMRAIEGYPGSIIVKAALKFSAYTFARPGEVRGAEWSEIDFGEALWRLPAHRMKMGRPHLVPLATQVLELLRTLQPLTGSSRFVFPAAKTAVRPLSENTVTVALLNLGYERGQVSAHGFRTTASTLLREQDWQNDWIEVQLAHGHTDKVRGAYDRAKYLPQRRDMMQAWADWIDGHRQEAQSKGALC